MSPNFFFGMKRFWSTVLTLALVICVTLAGNSLALAAKKQVPLTYTPAQQEQIQRFLTPVTALRDRMNELSTLIEKENWTDVRSFIHGPLGELRRRMNYLSDRLLPADRKVAKAQAMAVYGHLNELDAAAAAFSYSRSRQHYQDALADFDAFLETVQKSLN
ncbi:MAG: photosystem II protein PsbQ [Cyanobacteria bacterium]|nr:photosystem II protein PsbQ [Cyanobacteriota bacterium]MDW8201240.1 photosystem II protein PsbQ [Cyanobacteriota bacterium SKYGB_h_bin112]